MTRIVSVTRTVTQSALVACVGKKLNQPSPAKELYQSYWFKLARQYAEQISDHQWYILSALHGLVAPDKIIAPYDCTLTTMKKADRETWAAETLPAIMTAIPTTTQLVILAGRKYRDSLLPLLQAQGYGDITIPMSGLGIGQQMSWLNRHTGGKG